MHTNFSRALTALILLVSTTSQADLLVKNQYALQSSTSFPEGVAFDPVSDTFFPTAIFGGQITTVRGFDGQEGLFYQDTTTPGISFGGIKVDAARRMAWVCGTNALASPVPTSWIYGIRIRPGQTGQLLHRIELPAPSFCNDIALDAFGRVYASDSFQPTIYRVAADNSSYEVFATNPAFAAVPGGPPFGLNGIQVTPDQSHLIAIRTITPALFSVSMSNPSDVQAVSFTGDTFQPAGDFVRFPGPDGLAFLGLKAYVVSNGAVQQLKFTNSSFTQAEVKTNTTVPLGITSATTAYGKLYVINSQVVPVVDFGQPVTLPFTINKVDLSGF